MRDGAHHWIEDGIKFWAFEEQIIFTRADNPETGTGVIYVLPGRIIGRMEVFG